MSGAERTRREQAWREPGSESSESSGNSKETETQSRAPLGLKPHIDVTGKEPERPRARRTANHYALPSAERYPLDSYTQVEKAASYFDEWRSEMPPGIRREYAVNLVKRASALGIPLSKSATFDGAAGRAPLRTLELGIDSRREFLGIDENLLLDKLAGVAESVDPEVLSASLGELDRRWGLVEHYGDRVVEPHRTVFAPSAPEKTANAELAPRVIARLTELSGGVVTEKFGQAFAARFRTNPEEASGSLSSEQRSALALLAEPHAEGR